MLYEFAEGFTGLQIETGALRRMAVRELLLTLERELGTSNLPMHAYAEHSVEAQLQKGLACHGCSGRY